MNAGRRRDVLLRRALGLSSLWRSLSPRNAHHLAMAAASAAAGAARLALDLRSGDAPPEAAAAAVNTALMVFLAWAVAREVDPDRPSSALWGAALAVPVLLLGSAPAGAMAAALFALRVASRSTGQAPTALDLVFLVLLAGAVAATPRGWVGGAVIAAALVWDTALPQPAPPRNRLAAAAALAGAVGVAVPLGSLEIGFVRPQPVQWAAVGLGTLGFLLARSYRPASRQDRAESAVPEERVAAARRLALAAGVGAAGIFGGAAAPLLAGVWAALAGVGLYDRLAGRKKGRAG